MNIFFVGVLCEIFGLTLILYAIYIKLNNSIDNRDVDNLWGISFLNRLITKNNYTNVAMVIVSLAFLVGIFGRKIVDATANHGFFCIDNLVYGLLCVAFGAVLWLKYRFLSIYQGWGKKSQKEVSRCKIVLSMGVVVLFSGFLVQILGT